MLGTKENIDTLKQGGIGVIPTDTLYGMVASAWNETAVERGYILRNRDLEKACIILIADIADLEIFSVHPSSKEREWLGSVWPGKVSVLLSCPHADLRYLTRGTGNLAFRIPDDESLRAFLRETGPLIAPSTNPQGENPAETIAEAKEYFGDAVDFYIDGGMLQSLPSTIVKLENDCVTVIRSGAVKMNECIL